MKVFVVFALTILTSAVFAKPGPETILREAYSCGEKVTIPEGSNDQYFMSEDCKTVYVLPAYFGAINFTKVSLNNNVDEKSCDDLEQVPKRLFEIADLMHVYAEKRHVLFNEFMEKMEASTIEEMSIHVKDYETKLAVLDAEKAELDKEKEALLKIYMTDVPGGTLDLNISLNMKSQINAFKKANKKSKLNFRPVPFSKAYLSVGKPDPDIYGKSVVGFDITNAEEVAKGHYQDKKFLAANNGLNGKLTISQGFVCYAIKEQKDFRDVSAVANYTYFIKVNGNEVRAFTSGFSSPQL